MLEVRDQLDEYIYGKQWEVMHSWEDNCPRLGAIKVTNTNVVRANIAEDLSFFMQPTGWNRDKLQEYLPEAIVEHVIRMMNYNAKSYLPDNLWWMKTNSGKFTISSACLSGNQTKMTANGRQWLYLH